jgi:hypothetical protein
MTIWEVIEGFSPRENWGAAEKINGLLLLLLSAVRKNFGCRVIIHNGFRPKKRGQHYLGNAADFHFKWDNPEEALPFSKQVEQMITVLADLQVSHKVGLGIYPDWNNPGFHLDVRGSMARWGKIDTEDDYVSFDIALNYAREKEAA